MQINGWITNLRMWTDAEKAFCVEAYISSKSYKETRHIFFKKKLNYHNSDLALGKRCVKKWVEKFRENGTFKGGRGGKSRTVRTQANIKDVEDSVARSPKKSIRRRSQSLGLTGSKMHNIAGPAPTPISSANLSPPEDLKYCKTDADG